MTPYPKYRDSNLSWIGRIPEHWSVVPTFAALREKHMPNAGLRERTVLSLSYGRVVVKDIDNNFGLLPASFETYQIVQPGDIVLRFTDLQNDHKSLRVGLAKNVGIITSAYLCLAPRAAIDPRFAYYQLHSLDTQKMFYTMGGGLRQSMSYSDLRRMPLLLPPPIEQADIVAFLDRKSADIERFITKKRQLVALLHEQKIALINRAVTKGLNPDMPMKAAGVQWLGEVPAHWVMVPNKQLFKIKNDIVGSNHTQFTLLSLSLYGVIPRDMDNPQGKFPAAFDTYQIVEPGDLVFCLFDMDETPRTVGFASQRGMITGAYTVMRPIQESAAQYLYYFYLAMDNAKCLKPLYTGLRKVIQKGMFLSAKTPVPPPDEQAAIVAHIDAESAVIHKAIARIEREIELIQEYRTALIAEVVTGKIDVRQATNTKAEAAIVAT